MNKTAFFNLSEYASIKHCIDTYCIPQNKPIVFFEIGVNNALTSGGFYKKERKTHPSFLRGWDVSDSFNTYIL